MVNDKNHLYTSADLTKDRKQIEKRGTQQQFSRFSTTIPDALNVTADSPAVTAIQIATKPQIGDPINDTIGEVGFITQGIFFDVFGSDYTTLIINGDVTFTFLKLPKGRHFEFTIDFTINTGTPPTILFPSTVLNPPTLPTLSNGTRVVLYFIGVLDDISERYTFLGGNFATAGSGEFFGPWTANHDAGDFALNNVSSIQISDAVGGIHGIIQGLAAIGVRLTLTTSEQFNIFDNITNIFQVDNSGINIFGRDLGMGTGGNIIGGGAGEGMDTIGHLDFVDNLATPAAALSIYSDGTDMLVNTGGGVTNLSNILTNPLTTTLDFAGETADNVGIIISNAADPADSGFIRMGNAETLVWESNPTGVDVTLQVNSSNQFEFSGSIIPNGTRTLGLIGTRWNNVFTDNLNVNISALFNGQVFLGDTAGDLIHMAGTMNTDLKMGTFDITAIDQLEQEATGGILTHTFARPETLADDTTIGDIRFRAFDGLGTINNYASIRGIMKSDVNTGEDGGIQFFVAEAGVHDVLYMEINGNNNLEFIQFFKTVQIGEDIRMGGNPLILDTNLTTEINGLTADTIQFITNSALRGSFNNSGLSVIGTLDILGTTTLGDNIAVDKLSINAQIRTKIRWDLAQADAPLTGEMAIGRDGSGNLKISAPTGEHIALQINASDTIRILSDKVEFNDKIVFPISAGALGSTEFGLSRNGSEIQINTDSTFKVFVDAVEIAEFGSSFVQFPEVSVDPAAGTTSGKFYVKTVGGLAKPFFIGDGTAAVDLSTGGGGSQTPWTSDIDADGFDLKDLSNIEFRLTTGAPGISNSISADAGGMLFRTLAGDDFNFIVSSSIEYTFSSTTFGMSGNNINGMGNIQFTNVTPLGGTSIYISVPSATSDLRYNVATGNTHDFTVNNVTEYQFTAAQLDMNNNNLINVTDIELRAGFNTSKLFFDGGGDTYLTGGISGTINVVNDGTNTMAFANTAIILGEGHDISIGTITGTKIGLGATEKIGFYGTTPVVQQTVGSDTLANLYTALRAGGIIG